jgi:hypothetical protein
MPPQPHAEEEVAARAVSQPPPAFAGEPDALSVAHAGWDGHLERAAVRELEPAASAPEGLLEGELELGLEVGTASAFAEPAAEARSAGAAAEHLLEEVGDPREVREVAAVAEAEPNLLEAAAVGAAEASESRCARAVVTRLPVGAEPVVAPPLLGVAQHVVGLGDLLEALLGSRLLVHVGVVLARELPVRPPDLLVARPPGDTERLVVVAGGDGHQASSGVRATATRGGRSTWSPAA